MTVASQTSWTSGLLTTQRRRDAVFWVLLVGVLVWLLRPLFIGEIPPLVDFGGHLQMADVWARYEESEFFRSLFDKRDAWSTPNVLPARFVSALYPLLSPLNALRLFVALSLVGFALAMVFTLRTFQRSRWLVFVALPLIWNSMTMLGLLNYALAFVVMFTAIPLARRAARGGGVRHAVPLGLVALFGALTHVIGYVFTLAMIAYILTVGTRRVRGLLVNGVALLPSIALWVVWWLQLRARMKLKGAEVAGARSKFLSPERSIDVFFDESLDIAAGHWDTVVFVVMIAVLLALFASQRPATPVLPRVWSFKSAMRTIQQELDRHALITLSLALGVGFFFVTPVAIRDVYISPRLVVPILVLVCLSPRLDLTRRMTQFALMVAVGNTLYFGHRLASDVSSFQRTELAPLVEIIDKIPPGSRAQCSGVRWARPYFLRPPLDHNCNGLIQTRRESFAGGGFAHTAYNGTKLKDKRVYTKLYARDWTQYRQLRRIDYAVLRGAHAPPTSPHVRLVAAAGGQPSGAGDITQVWSLYEVVLPTRVPPTHEEEVGGDGGLAFTWSCEEGEALSSLGVSISRPVAATKDADASPANTRPDTEDGVASSGGGNRYQRLVSLRPSCRRLERDDLGLAWQAGSSRGPAFGGGSGTRQTSLSCASDSVIVGLAGHSDKTVTELGVVCASLEQVRAQATAAKRVNDKERPLAEERQQRLQRDALSPWWHSLLRGWPSKFVGWEVGTPFWMRCPPGHVVHGVVGQDGAAIDAVGIACVELETASAPLPFPPTNNPEHDL